MATPAPKAKGIADMLDALTGRSEKIKSDICVSCDGPAVEFKDDLSCREYTISGMCQACQDSVFNV